MKIFKKVKEIVSKEGVLHFKRYAIIETSFFALYIHRIYEADKDEHMHNHPWSYLSLILNGSYVEHCKEVSEPIPISKSYYIKRTFGSISIGTKNKFHKITNIIKGPVTTLFFTWGKHSSWYYDVKGVKIENDVYRKLKHQGKL